MLDIMQALHKNLMIYSVGPNWKKIMHSFFLHKGDMYEIPQILLNVKILKYEYSISLETIMIIYNVMFHTSCR